MTKEELERIDDRGMKVWDDHDVDTFLGLFADEFVWRDTTVPEPMTNREAARQYMLSWFTAFPDMRLTASNRVIGDDALAAEVLFTGTNTGPLHLGASQLPPTGRSVVSRGSYFVKMQDGKVIEFSTHPDVAGLMMQLGLMPQEMPGAAR